MAFQQRTPLEDFVGRITTEQAGELIRHPLDSISGSKIRHLNDHFAYSLSDEQKQWVTKQGVELSPYPHIVHTHPLSKTLENHFLYNILPPFFNSVDDMTLLTIKTNKYERLKRKAKDFDLNCINRIVTGRDYSRYGRKTPMSRIGLHKHLNIFIHDEVHHWNESQLETFLQLYRPNMLALTMVFPVEILFGYDFSLLPFAYTFQIEGDMLAFFPDGHRPSAYRQPLDSGNLLRKNHVRVDDMFYSIDMISSLGAHHFLVLNRADESCLLEKRRYFGTYPYLDIGVLFARQRVPLKGIKSEVLKKIIIYLMSLKKPDPQSAVAKLRQLMNDEVSLDAVWVVRDLCARIQRGLDGWSSVPLKKTLQDWLCDHSLGLCDKLNLVDDFDRKLMGLKEVELDLDLEMPVRKPDDILESLDSLWETNHPLPSTSDRAREPYTGYFISLRYKIDLKAFTERVERYMHRRRNPTFSGHSGPVLPIEYPMAKATKESPKEIPVPSQPEADQEIPETPERNNGRYPETINETAPELPPPQGVKIKGRTAQFFSRDGFDYGHGTQFYRNSGWPAALERFYEDYGFNSMLYQVYEKGASIGFHADDEECYDLSSNPVLTINTAGTADFICRDDRGDTKISLTPGSSLWMPEEYQTYGKHSVRNCSEGRTSMTFRIQRRNVKKGKVLKGAPAPAKLEEERYSQEQFEALPLDDQVLNCIPYSCFFKCLTTEKEEVSNVLLQCADYLWTVYENKGVPVATAIRICKDVGYSVQILEGLKVTKSDAEGILRIKLENGHYELVKDFSAFDSLTQNKKKKREVSTKKFDLGPLEEAGGFYTKVCFEALQEAAEKLLVSLLDGTSGIVSQGMRGEGFRIVPGARNEKDALSIIKRAENKKKDIITVLGFAGSGKSHGIQQRVNEEGNPKELLLLSPRRQLMGDWQKKCPKLTCKTYESGLKDDLRAYSCVILDELSLYPAGYLDLLIIKADLLQHSKMQVIVVGDPLQAKYHCKEDQHRLFKTHEIDRLGEVNYGLWTRRLPVRIANKLSIETTSNCPGTDIAVFNSLPEARADARKRGLEIEVILCASREEKKTFEDNTLTFGESQGLTYDYGLISLSEEARLSSDQQILVALTRFKKGFGLIYNAKGDYKVYARNCKGLLLRLLGKPRISIDYLLNMTKNKLVLNKMGGTGAGLDEQDREQRLAGDNWLKGQIYLGQRVNMVSEDELLVEEQMNPGKVHIPISTEKFITLSMDQIRSKYHREIRTRSGSSNQILEEHTGRGHTQLPQPSLVESRYLRHSSCDDITFWAAVKKRLRFAKPDKNYRSYLLAKHRGSLMLKAFLELVPLKPITSGLILEEAEADFEEKKLQKSAAQIANHSERSDPDLAADMVKIFLKNQLCTKFEKRFVDAKPGQTIACFHHRVLVRFAPICRYIEKVFTLQCPKNIYVHQKKNFDVLESFVTSEFTGDTCVESDYEAFDTSQDASTLAFEVALMEHLKMPQHYIDDYVTMKTTLGCRLGALAIMRFTGEFCTFLFNTFANIAFTSMRYSIPKGTPILFAGDDMCALRNLNLRSDYNEVLERLTLKAKVCRTNNPLFCGWRLTKWGLYKEPILVLERLLISIERGTLSDTINSYFLEFKYAYSKGGLLEDIMSEDQMDAHHRCIRLFLEHQNLLHSKNNLDLHEGLE